MSYTITIKNNESDWQDEKELEFMCFDVVYYVFKKRKKWVIRKSIIDGWWYTNLFGYKLDNGWTVYGDKINKLHKNKDDAINQCIELNKQDLVKIYNKDAFSFVEGYDE